LLLLAAVEEAVIALEEFLMALVEVDNLIANLREIVITLIRPCLEQLVFIQVFPDLIEMLSS